MAGWLAARGVALAFSTYQAGKLFLVGHRPDGQLSVFERTFDRCMGLWADAAGQTLWAGTRHQLWRFANVLRAGQSHDGHDRLYVPRTGHTTGDLDVHDVSVDPAGRPTFVATRFNCLATLDDRDSFAPVWRPPFITALAAEDRCHLNGLAAGPDGRPAYVTACATTDVADGWRACRTGGGVVLDASTGRTVVSGLSMPHSPRLHDGRLYVHNSGAGQFGAVDPATGTFAPIAFCPGYLRGLAFVGRWAVVGLSKPRYETFAGLPLDAAMAARGAKPMCGLQVVDLATGSVDQWLRVEGSVTELYDVAVLRGAARPAALGFKTNEIDRLVTAAPPAGA